MKTPDKYTILALIFGLITGFGLIVIGKAITKIIQLWTYQN